jgi:hypothetical protein
MVRSVLRRIRVASKDGLKVRILAYLDALNREPVIHTWTYKIDTVVRYEFFLGNVCTRVRQSRSPPGPSSVIPVRPVVWARVDPHCPFCPVWIFWPNATRARKP